VALTLLVGAGLLGRSLAALLRVPTGFRADSVLAAQLQLPPSRYGDPATRLHFHENVLGRLARRTGIVSAGVISHLPFSGAGNSGTFRVEGRSVPRQEKQPHAEMWSASPGYFGTLGIPLRRGRLFDARDGAQGLPVAIVNDTLARRFFPGEDPLGRRIDFEGSRANPFWREIVGVVGDVRDRRLDAPPEPQLYTPYAQWPEEGLFLVVRAEGDALAALPIVRPAVQAVDAELPLYNVSTMERITAAHTQNRRAATTALGLFAGAAVLLAVLGLYGLLTQTVRERVPEIGVRLALGARRRDVLRLFLAEGARLVLVGLVVGFALALAASRLLRGLVFGIATTDPATYGLVALLLSNVALAACALPAWRAGRVDPMRALRTE
jgi:putative ABC transport system permease protein